MHAVDDQIVGGIGGHVNRGVHSNLTAPDVGIVQLAVDLDHLVGTVGGDVVDDAGQAGVGGDVFGRNFAPVHSERKERLAVDDRAVPGIERHLARHRRVFPGEETRRFSEYGAAVAASHLKRDFTAPESKRRNGNCHPRHSAGENPIDRRRALRPGEAEHALKFAVGILQGVGQNSTYQQKHPTLWNVS